MQAFTALYVILGVTCSSAAGVLAVTPAWSYETTNAIFQVVPDGKGGCAVVTVAVMIGPVISGRLLWLDRDGRLRYQTGLSNIYAGIVADCTSSRLIFADTRPDQAVYVVDESGTVTTVPAEPGTINRVTSTKLPFGFYRNDMIYDRKGFFVVEVTTNQSLFTLIRYSNK